MRVLRWSLGAFFDISLLHTNSRGAGMSLEGFVHTNDHPSWAGARVEVGGGCWAGIRACVTLQRAAGAGSCRTKRGTRSVPCNAGR